MKDLQIKWLPCPNKLFSSMHSLEMPGGMLQESPFGIVSNKQSSGQCVSADVLANTKSAQIHQIASATTMADL